MYTFGIYRHFVLKGYHTINVPTEWFIVYGQMERDVDCVIPCSCERPLSSSSFA